MYYEAGGEAGGESVKLISRGIITEPSSAAPHHVDKCAVPRDSRTHGNTDPANNVETLQVSEISDL